ncbi:filamentous hemagglutinin N-terminal domain-containing protein [Halomonas sp. ZH2S]|uniref:Filamentous hemagglutinin N-terminal domain-containing protein n=1 Tax=Vreelandella zhuhanensis TaxID=2684210 RepID=A0A7X3KQM8_9GAMM|nr:filamentous hemagglutinin N-terminal domain-containing protein [Halomonas zhuhanensis]MWJ28078.1 filamentous hemagglutinin N-terminal domain-containing protein [Halomonas zhuhanensis]
MNRIFQSIWNQKVGTFVAVSECAKNGGRKIASSCYSTSAGGTRFILKPLVASMLLVAGGNAWALPVGGEVSAGGATIGGDATAMEITQTTQNAAINWQAFDIASGEAVNFAQPNSSSVVLNRVLGSDPSAIMGTLTANGNVFLINPNGVLFGQNASVNVGGLVASTLSLSDSDFMAGRYNFAGTGDGSIVNQGAINADGGYIALLGANVSNQGTLQANLGTVALAAGDAITLDVAGDGLLNVAVNQGALDALVQNGGMIQADGGTVLMTAQSAGDLFQSTVNNTGMIRAQSIENRNGTIMLMGDMRSGTVKVGGTLDASAANGGDGGFIETSAAHVKIANDVQITTAAPLGKTGTWLIDPVDFVISSDGDIAGSTLSAQLVTSNVRIENVPGAGNGDIFVNEAVTWTPTPNPTTLTLNASRDVIVNEAITTTGGNLQLFAERDVVLKAPITTTSAGGGGDLTAVAGRNIEVNALAALTTTGGDILLLAANDGTGVGTVNFAPGAPPVAVTGPLSSVNIFYAPVSYDTPTDFSGNFTLTGGATLTTHMWVFPEGVNKMYDGNTDATLELMGNPTRAGDVSLQSGAASFDSANVGTDKTVTYSGYSLGGDDAGLFALFAPFNTVTAEQGVPGAGVTTANITQAPLTITAIGADKEFGVELDPETLTYEQEGLVPGETIGDVTLTSPGTAATADVGDHDIKPSDAEPGSFDPNNYEIDYKFGTLEVYLVETTDPVDPIPDPVDPVDTTVPGDTIDPIDPSTTDPSTTDPSTTDPGDPVAPTPTDPEITDPSTTDPSTTDPDGSEPSLPLAVALSELPEEALRPVISFPDENGDSPENISEGLELTFATAAVNMPTLQLERLDPPAETDLLAPQVEAYVPPVYEPKQDRF